MLKLVLSLIFILPSCTKSLQDPVVTKEKLPQWVESPKVACQSGYICAVGSSGSFSGALSDARSNIAKQFKTDLSSTFISSESQLNNDENRYTSDVVEEVVSGILEGVEISNTHNANHEYYAFATLKKSFALQKIRNEIKKIDDDMSDLMSKNFINKYKLLKLHNLRSEINKQHLFIAGGLLPEKIKYSDILNIKSSGKYYINSNGNTGVSRVLKNIITQNGSYVVDEPSKADKLIEIKLTSRERYINVRNFKAFEILLDISVRQNSKIIGSLNNTFSNSGVAKDDVLSDLLNEIESYLEKNIDMLNL